MNLLILGGSGFLSGTVAREARGAGHDVTVVTRGNRPVPDGVAAVVADRNEAPAFKAAVEAHGRTWDLVIDCIGFNAADARQDLEVFSALAAHLVFISTDFVLDPGRRAWEVDESCEDFDTESAYGRGKRDAECVLLEDAGASAGLAVTVLRPCHIYGPGSELGCLPRHGRDPELIPRLRRGEPLRLVGGGHFLQQPVYAADVANMALSCHGNPDAVGRLFHAAGPDVVTSREYYRIVADHLGVELRVEEESITAYLKEEPEHLCFCRHRVYRREKGAQAGLRMPDTSLVAGLGAQVDFLVRERPPSGRERGP